MYSEIRGLHQAAYLLALFAFGSQLLAIVRDRALSHTFGAGRELDLYYAAFRIPDLLFVVFASVLSVYVLLPFVERARATSGEGAAARLLSQCFTLFLSVYAVVAVVLWVALPYLIPFLFPGLTADAEILTTLTRILLLQPFFLGLSTLFGVVTQAERRFVLYALSPLLYNLGIIIGVVLLYPLYGLNGVVVGVVAGAIGHLAVQYPLVRKSSLRFDFARSIDWRAIRELILAALPRAATLSAHQLSLFVLIAIATMMTVGSVAVFQLAFNLQSVPLAIIGMSYSVAAFPMLAECMAKNDRANFVEHVVSALRHIIFWSLPAIGLIIVLRAQMVRALFGSGNFDWDDTRLTAAVVALLVVSLVGQSLLLLFVRAFYAAGRMALPLLIAIVGVVVTVVSAFFFDYAFTEWPFLLVALEELLRLTEVSGTEVLVIPLAFTFGVLVEAVLLVLIFARNFGLPFGILGKLFLKSTFAALAGAGSAYLTLQFIVDGVNQETLIGIVLQGTAAGFVGLCAVVLAYAAVRSRELAELYASFRARLFKADVIAPQTDTIA